MNEKIFLDNLLERSGMSYDELLKIEKEYPIVKVLIYSIFEQKERIKELEERMDPIEEVIKRILKIKT